MRGSCIARWGLKGRNSGRECCRARTFHVSDASIRTYESVTRLGAGQAWFVDNGNLGRLP